MTSAIQISLTRFHSMFLFDPEPDIHRLQARSNCRYVFRCFTLLWPHCSVVALLSYFVVLYLIYDCLVIFLCISMHTSSLCPPSVKQRNWSFCFMSCSLRESDELFLSLLHMVTSVSKTTCLTYIMIKLFTKSIKRASDQCSILFLAVEYHVPRLHSRHRHQSIQTHNTQSGKPHHDRLLTVPFNRL